MDTFFFAIAAFAISFTSLWLAGIFITRPRPAMTIKDQEAWRKNVETRWQD